MFPTGIMKVLTKTMVSLTILVLTTEAMTVQTVTMVVQMVPSQEAEIMAAVLTVQVPSTVV